LDQHLSPDDMPTVRHKNENWHRREPSGWHAGNYPASDRCLGWAQDPRRIWRVTTWTREDLRTAKRRRFGNTAPGLGARGHRSPGCSALPLGGDEELHVGVAERRSRVKTAIGLGAPLRCEQ
jgi:hypothetical protein